MMLTLFIKFYRRCRPEWVHAFIFNGYKARGYDGFLIPKYIRVPIEFFHLEWLANMISDFFIAFSYWYNQRQISFWRFINNFFFYYFTCNDDWCATETEIPCECGFNQWYSERFLFLENTEKRMKSWVKIW